MPHDWQPLDYRRPFKRSAEVDLWWRCGSCGAHAALKDFRTDDGDWDWPSAPAIGDGRLVVYAKPPAHLSRKFEAEAVVIPDGHALTCDDCAGHVAVEEVHST